MEEVRKKIENDLIFWLLLTSGQKRGRKEHILSERKTENTIVTLLGEQLAHKGWGGDAVSGISKDQLYNR